MVDVSRLSNEQLDAILADSREQVSDPDLRAMSEDELMAFAQSLTQPPSGSAGAAPIPVRTADVPSGGDLSALITGKRPDASGYMLPATFSRGIVKGFTGLPDLLARSAGLGLGYLAEKAGFPEADVESLKNPFTIGGALDTLQPTAPNQEGAEVVGEGIGGALSGVGLARAIAAVPEALKGGEVLRNIANMMAEQPVLQSVAGGSGALASYEAEKAGLGPTGQMVAGLIGGFAPVAATNVASAGARALLAPLSGDFAETGAANLLQQKAVDPRRAAASIRAQAEANMLPGVRPTTAELASDPGLAALQRGLGNTSVSGAADMSDRMQANMAARARAISEAGGTGDPDALLQAAVARQQGLDELTRRAAERVGALNPADVSGEALRVQLALRAAAAKAAAQEKYAAVPEDVEPIQIGALEPTGTQSLTAPPAGKPSADDVAENLNRELSDRGLDPARMQAEDWDAFYRDTSGPPLPIGEDDVAFLAAGADKAAGRATLSPFQASLMTLRRKFFPGTGLPADSSVSALLRQLENADVLSARQTERIVSDLREQSRLLKMTDPRSGALAKAAADATEGLLMQQAGPARAEALRDARAAWRDYKTTFAENEPGRILADKFGRPVLDVSRAPGMAVPGNVTGGTATRRLVAAAGPEAAEQAAREELRRALDLAGDSSTRISALMSANRYGPVLAEYPALASEVTAARDAAAMAEAFATSRLGRLSTSNVSPSQSIATAVAARDNGVALRNIAGAVRGDPAAQAGLRRALIEYILPSDARGAMTAAGDVVASPLRTMETLSAVLGRTANTDLFNAAQRKVMNEALRQLKALRFANTAARVSGSDTVMNKNLLVDKVSRLALEGTVPGAGRAVRMLDAVIGAVADTDAIGALAREAMLDPQLAARLLERVTPSRLSQLADTLNATIRGTAAGAVAEDIQPLEDDTGLSAMPMEMQ